MADFYDILGQWQNAAKNLAGWKAEEMRLRLLLVTSTFTTPTEGTNKAPLKDGSTLVMQHKLTREVQDKRIAEVDQALFHAGANRGVEHYLNRSVTLKVGEYKDAPPHIRAILDRMIVTKPGAPSLEVKANAVEADG